MSGRMFGEVLTYEEVHELSISCCAGVKAWMKHAFEEFKYIVGNEGFPCLFGKKSSRSESAMLVFISECNAAQDMAVGLGGYVGNIASLSIKDRLSKPLIIFFEKNKFTSLADEQLYAWSILQEVHKLDRAPWPDDVSTDIENEAWSFCFMGVSLFINMSFPQHKVMKSRNLGSHIVFVVNPRENFDYVASGETISGKRIRERIRLRSDAYNKGFKSPSLGVYGDTGSLEIKQYQLEESGSLRHDQCPFKMDSDKVVRVIKP